MSRPKHAVELCSLLVDDIYGELSSRIFTILLRRGRLSMVALKRHTQLTTRQLKLGLTVLVRQNLVYHNSEGGGDTNYEANIDAAYALVRSGKILEIVGERFGSVASDIMEQLVLLGHAKISDIIAELDKSHEAQINGNGNGINGATNGNGTHSYPLAQLNHTLIQLLEEGFIQPVGQNMFRSPTDSYNAVEKALLQDSYGGATRGTKQKDELRMRIRGRLQELRAEIPNWKPVGYNRQSTNGHMNGIASKRRRLSHNGSATNGYGFVDDESNKLDGNLVLRINHEKCTVAMRNRRLVELANSRIGETTSYIYGELLRLLAERIPRCRPDPTIDDVVDAADGPSITITTQELTDALSKTINVSTGIGKTTGQNIDTSRLGKLQNGRKRKARDEAEVEGDASSDEESENDHKPFANGNGHAMDIDDDDFSADQSRTSTNRRAVSFQDQDPSSPPPAESRQARMMHVMNHLQLLAADDCQLLRKCGTRQMGEWTVDFERVIERLRELEIDSIIYENFGKNGHRLVRVMRKMGKLEEKHISKVGLVKQQDARTKLVEMQLHGMVDVQEVPRDPGRMIVRTVFLWFFDQDRVASLLLARTYKAMSRCLQRLDVEKRRKADIIALSERTDVQGQEEAILRPEQMNQLREIRAKEEDLLGQIGRLDDLVGVFHDY
ncbi:RNA polymerase III subunit C82 [Ciborinia camelliae]|nr:RNA polymerase III subunit C82 [Ciborinia camelliae]